MKPRKAKKPHLVLVGNGMAGIACLEQILRYGDMFDITIFGDETHVNYSRILLSNVLAGVHGFDDITLNPLEWYRERNISLRLGVRITGVDAVAHTITGDDGAVTSYDKLLIATGSHPFVPPVPGLEKKGVCAWRTLDDTQRLLEWSAPGKHAIVLGGGLLGLEAARGLQVQGCQVTVIHLLDTLMNRQLDSTGGHYVQRKMENLGITVRKKCTVRAIHGKERVESVELNTGKILPADFVVVAAGILPNAELGRMAGLEVKRGIVVNDFLETSHPDIFAVGECVEHRGMTYGLVAPLIEQGKVLAATITGNKGPTYEGSSTATKLKVAGVEVFSAGLIEETEPGLDVVRYEDPGLGIYKKLVLKGGQMVGAILVGDTSESGRYMEWIRSKEDLTAKRRNLLIPEPPKDPGASIAEMSDSEVVCGCMGVSKGTIITAIHDRGICTLSQLKEATRASAGCGSCAGTCTALLAAVAPGFEPDRKQVLCSCVPFPEEQLREMVHTQQIRSVQQVLDIYGNGTGCEKCRPALSYMVDMVWCGEHEEDRSSRFINDRVHANIQKDGTFSVVPRMRGGVTSPAELRRIAEVAEKYNVPLVKVTGSQRLDLLGVKKQDLPGIWADLGMPSGQAYAKGVRMVKTCVGSEFCRFGTQDAISTGVELEKRLENLFTPHKTKLAVVGCPRNCAEATVKDIGLVGQEGSWQVVVGGAAGKSVRKADVLVTVASTEEALESAELFFQYYREHANYLERTYDFVERTGMDKIRRETVYAVPEARAGLLDRLRKAKSASYDAWLEGDQPKTATQFVQIQPMEAPEEVSYR
ncbi:nitrite reductase large subunit NirB [Paludibaculum fermentans]|uniref:nitrite reductase large subunit NirB n=1 Tax=Paludibaculum fermentans TaxID=1473598 RepID=UPI003EB7ADE5